MKEYTAATYGDRIAERYDHMHPDGPATQAVANVLAGLAPGGRALELGIGTGRVALPLAARGVEVHGIDASQAMVAKLHAKPGGAAIPVTIDDFAEFQLHSKFGLVFVVSTRFSVSSPRTHRYSASGTLRPTWNPVVCSSSRRSYPTPAVSRAARA